MLNFFRKLKKHLLSRNPYESQNGIGKFSKFLGYALGEIALVMTGILLALQVNNWNETRKERIMEQEILADLLENMEINLNTLEADIQFNRALNRSSEIILNTLNNKLPYHDSLQPHFHNARITRRELFLSRTGYEAYKDLGLSLLTNKALKNKILTLFETIYPSILAKYALVNTYLPKFDDHVVQNFIYTNQKLQPVAYQQLFTDHYYISWIRAYKEGRKDLIALEYKMMSETQSVLQGIENEILAD